MTLTKIVSGWGNHPKQEAQLLAPSSCAELQAQIREEKSIIARGLGRSYGDSANAAKILQTSYYDHFIEFDHNAGLLTAEAGITLREILKVVVPRGWFLPVTPGTSYVTLGGAIASDVHGKNHHLAGTFGRYVKSITMALGTGEIVITSPTDKADLYLATCGGMGLTGVIIAATIQLTPIRSSLINRKTIKVDCIEDACAAFEDNCYSTYSVAWIDCLAKGKKLGRSVLMLGEHLENGGLEVDVRDPLSIPFYTPSALLNRITMKTFNAAYWHSLRGDNTKIIPLMPYFYPLDAIGFWNKLYGKHGFLQYQCVIPKDYGITNIRKLLTEIAESGNGSFLATLKLFGKANDNFLSFPIEGFTLALDFKFTPSITTVLNRLDNQVEEVGGRVYLTKDAVMQESTFKSMYSNWEMFESVREKYGAIGKFSSAQSKRLGLA